MAAVNPPAHIQALTESSDVFRRVIRTLRSQQGIRQLTDLAVTAQVTPNMTVQVAGGECVIDGTQDLIHQGSYHCLSDASVNLTIAASNPTLPRIDLVVAQVQDAQYSGSTNAWSLAVVTGTAASSPVVPTAPPNSLALAQVLVPASATSITSSDITDMRVPGTGQMVTRIGQQILTTNTASVTFSNIPQYYNTLHLIMQGYMTSSSTRANVSLQFNGDTGAHYDAVDGVGSSGTGGGIGGGNNWYQLAATTAVVGNFAGGPGGAIQAWIPNYAKQNGLYNGYLQVMSQGGTWDGTNIWEDLLINQWRSTSPVTSLKILTTTSWLFYAGSSFTLYGYP